MNNNKNEKQNILNQELWDLDASFPSKRFYYKLKALILFKFIVNKMQINMQNKKLILSGAAISLLVIVTLSTALIYPIVRNSYLNKNIDKQAILNQALSKRSSSSTLATSSRSGAESDKMATSDLAINFPTLNFGISSIEEDQNYSKLITEIIPGKKVGSCPVLSSNYSLVDGVTNVTATYELFSDNNNYFNKSFMVNNKGEIYNYYLQLPTVHYQFQGGKYAIKYSFTADIVPYTKDSEIPSEQPSEGFPITPAEIINIDSEEISILPIIEEEYDPFANYKLIGEENYNGSKYYVFEEIADYTCEFVNYSPRTLVKHLWISQDENEILKEIYFDGNTNKSNLILEATYNTSYDNLSIDSATQLFSFDIKTKVYDHTYDYSIDKLIEYIETKKFTVLGADSVNTKLNSIYTASENLTSIPIYWTDRDYYLPGKAGDMIFDWLNPGGASNVLSRLEAGYSYKDIATITSYLYDANVNKGEILKNFSIAELYKSLGKKDIAIGNTTVDAEIYVSEYENMIYNEGDESKPVDQLESYTSTTYFIIFEYNNNIHTLSIYQNGAQSYTLDEVLGSMVLLDLNDSQKLNNFLSDIRSIQNNQQERG
jgi:hypothetical protein